MKYRYRTPRPARPNEIDGVDYHFVTNIEFEALIAADVFLEHAKVFGHNHYYGTSRDSVLARLQAGVDVILEIDWQGARQVRSWQPECCSIFILPPSLASLRQRLQARAQDSEQVIDQRMKTAVEEITHYDEFDYLIVNDDFETALTALRSIFIANRLRLAPQRQRQRRLLQALLS